MRTLALWLLVLAAPAALAGSFSAYHPDQYQFKQAMEAFERGRHAESAAHFRRAARYADKPAQLALAVLARDGVGRTRDLAEAYAWADLAAERGYRAFLLEREAIWERLTPDERRRAIELGTALYAEYGDAVAKPRLEKLLRIGRSKQTGTRTRSGATATGVVDLTDPAARATFMATFLSQNTNPLDFERTLKAFGAGITAASRVGANAFAGDYYADENWEPKAYWAARDFPWVTGTVTVSPIVQDDGGSKRD
jgi:hypothetical protein